MLAQPNIIPLHRSSYTIQNCLCSEFLCVIWMGDTKIALENENNVLIYSKSLFIHNNTMRLIWYIPNTPICGHIYSFKFVMKSERKMRKIKFLQFKKVHVFHWLYLWIILYYFIMMGSKSASTFRHIPSTIEKKRDPKCWTGTGTIFQLL